MICFLRLPRGACWQPGKSTRGTFLPNLVSIRSFCSLLLVVLLDCFPLLLWPREAFDARVCLASAAAGPAQQQQAVADCVMYIYADIQQKPVKMRDQTSCPTGGGNRAFLVDRDYKGRSTPKLLEVAPLSDHKVLCKYKKPCNLVVTGYGLEQEDQLILVHLEDSNSSPACPPDDFTPQHQQEQQPHQRQIQGTRHIRTSSKLAYDHSVRPQNQQTIMTVFQLGNLEEGNYLICYSTSRSTPEEKAQQKDFHYKAGTIGKFEDAL